MSNSTLRSSGPHSAPPVPVGAVKRKKERKTRGEHSKSLLGDKPPAHKTFVTDVSPTFYMKYIERMEQASPGGLPADQQLPPQAVKLWKDRYDAVAISTRIGRPLKRETPVMKIMKSNLKKIVKAQLGDDAAISDVEMPGIVESSGDEYPYQECYDGADSDQESDDGQKD